MDYNINLGKHLLPLVAQVLKYCTCPQLRHYFQQPPRCSLWSLKPHIRQMWLKALLVILYKVSTSLISFSYSKSYVSSEFQYNCFCEVSYSLIGIRGEFPFLYLDYSWFWPQKAWPLIKKNTEMWSYFFPLKKKTREDFKGHNGFFQLVEVYSAHCTLSVIPKCWKLCLWKVLVFCHFKLINKKNVLRNLALPASAETVDGMLLGSFVNAGLFILDTACIN